MHKLVIFGLLMAVLFVGCTDKIEEKALPLNDRLDFNLGALNLQPSDFAEERYPKSYLKIVIMHADEGVNADAHSFSKDENKAYEEQFYEKLRQNGFIQLHDANFILGNDANLPMAFMKSVVILFDENKNSTEGMQWFLKHFKWEAGRLGAVQELQGNFGEQSFFLKVEEEFENEGKALGNLIGFYVGNYLVAISSYAFPYTGYIDESDIWADYTAKYAKLIESRIFNSLGEQSSRETNGYHVKYRHSTIGDNADQLVLPLADEGSTRELFVRENKIRLDVEEYNIIRRFYVNDLEFHVCLFEKENPTEFECTNVSSMGQNQETRRTVNPLMPSDRVFDSQRTILGIESQCFQEIRKGDSTELNCYHPEKKFLLYKEITYSQSTKDVTIAVEMDLNAPTEKKFELPVEKKLEIDETHYEDELGQLFPHAVDLHEWEIEDFRDVAFQFQNLWVGYEFGKSMDIKPKDKSSDLFNFSQIQILKWNTDLNALSAFDSIKSNAHAKEFITETNIYCFETLLGAGKAPAIDLGCLNGKFFAKIHISLDHAFNAKEKARELLNLINWQFSDEAVWKTELSAEGHLENMNLKTVDLLLSFPEQAVSINNSSVLSGESKRAGDFRLYDAQEIEKYNEKLQNMGLLEESLFIVQITDPKVPGNPIWVSALVTRFDENKLTAERIKEDLEFIKETNNTLTEDQNVSFGDKSIFLYIENEYYFTTFYKNNIAVLFSISDPYLSGKLTRDNFIKLAKKLEQRIQLD